MVIVIVLAALLILAIAAVFFISWLLFCMACSKKIPKIIAPLMNSLIGGFSLGELDMVVKGKAFYREEPSESWYTTSRDGLKLHAKYFPCEGARGTVILFHGYRSSALHDFSGVLPYYNSLGLNILMCDHRAHGESEGKYITFGVLERFDVLSWVDEHNRRVGADVPVILDGISMGGATVAYAASEPLAENVCGIMDDCGYTYPKDQIYYVMGLMKIPPFPFYHVADMFCRAFAKFSFSDVDARDTLSKTRIPCMFIHGEADDFVLCKMGIECHDACSSEKSIFLCPEAGHGMSYITQTDKCKEFLREFVDKVIPPKQ